MAGVDVVVIVTIGAPVQEARREAISKKQFRVSVTRRFVMFPQEKGVSNLTFPKEPVVAVKWLTLPIHYTRERIKKDTGSPCPCCFVMATAVERLHSPRRRSPDTKRSCRVHLLVFH